MSCGHCANCLSGFPCDHVPPSDRGRTPSHADIAAKFDELASLFFKDSDNLNFPEFLYQALESFGRTARDQQVPARSQSTKPREVPEALIQALEMLGRSGPQQVTAPSPSVRPQQVPAPSPSTRPQQVPILKVIPASIYVNGHKIPRKVRRVLKRAMARRAALIKTHRSRLPSRPAELQQDPRLLQVPPRVSRAGAKGSHPTAARKSMNGREKQARQTLPQFFARLLAKLPLRNVPRVKQLEVYRLLQHNDPTLTALSAQEDAALRSSLRCPYDALSYLLNIDHNSSMWNDIETILSAHPNEHFESLSQVLKLVFGCHKLGPKQSTKALANEPENFFADFFRSLKGQVSGHATRDSARALEAQTHKLQAEAARPEEDQGAASKSQSNSHRQVPAEPLCPFLTEIRGYQEDGYVGGGIEVRFSLKYAAADSPCTYLAKYARRFAGTSHEVPNCWLVRPKADRFGMAGFSLTPTRRAATLTGRGN